MNYLVIEIQTSENGDISNIVTAFSDKSTAEQAYHNILAVAAMSDVYIHAASILDIYGNVVESEYYNHINTEATTE